MSLEILLIAFGLGMDTFAVGVGSATVFQVPVRRSVFRLSFHFGLFQGSFFAGGYLAATEIVRLISFWDHFLAMGLLGVVGLRMIWEGISQRDNPGLRADPSKGWRLIMLSVATSIDALAVGLSFGMLEREVLEPAIVIGLVSCGTTIVGILLGRGLRAGLGRYAEILGGLVLIGIGLKILFEHIGLSPGGIAP